MEAQKGKYQHAYFTMESREPSIKADCETKICPTIDEWTKSKMLALRLDEWTVYKFTGFLFFARMGLDCESTK